VAEAEAAAEPMEVRLAAGGLATAVAAAIAAGVALDLLLNRPANHTAAVYRFLVRDAADHGTSCLIRNRLRAANGVGFGLGFRHALAARDLALFLANFALVDRYLARYGPAFADALVATDSVLFPGRAGYPAANRLGPNAAVIARLAAAVVVATAELVQSFSEGRAAGLFTAFIVALVDAAANHLGFRLADDVGFHDGALLDARDAHADLPGHCLDLGNHLVHRAGARPGFRNAFATIRGVALLLTLSGVNGTGGLEVFGDPLFDAHGAVLRGTRRATVVGASGQSRRSHDAASQQGNANMLPDHAISLDAILADPGRHRDTPLGRTGQPVWLNVIQLCPT